MSGLIVHEWIEEHGGAEKVVDAMVQAYPDSDISCLWNDAPDRYPNNSVTESWISRSPLRGRKALALPFMSPTWRNLEIDSYDWALVSSHLFAHHVAFNKKASTIPIYVYVHTPARYIWEPQLDPRGRNPAARMSSPFFRKIDTLAASQGGLFAANSQFVKDRICKAWGQPAEVIYPPVQVARLQAEKSWSSRLSEVEFKLLSSLPRDFILGASRFVKYKGLPKVIAAGESCDIPVVIAGSGPDIDQLRTMAASSTVPVTIIERPSDELLYALYEKAMLFVFPPIEDFGIMPVEAMALGTPVIVNAIGGAAESAALLAGGVAIDEDDFSSRAAVEHAVRAALAIDMNAVKVKASAFSEESFILNMREWMSMKNNESTLEKS